MDGVDRIHSSHLDSYTQRPFKRIMRLEDAGEESPGHMGGHFGGHGDGHLHHDGSQQEFDGSSDNSQYDRVELESLGNPSAPGYVIVHIDPVSSLEEEHHLDLRA